MEEDLGSSDLHCSDINSLLLASSEVYGGGATAWTEGIRGGRGGGRPQAFSAICAGVANEAADGLLYRSSCSAFSDNCAAVAYCGVDVVPALSLEAFSAS